MQKLKAVFRSSSKRRAQHSKEADQPEATTPHSSHNNRRATSLDERRPRPSSEAAKASTQHRDRNRPLSSVYDSCHLGDASVAQPVAVDYAQLDHSQEIDESIANDYKAYHSALSSIHDAQDEQYTLGGDKRLITVMSDTPHEEIADKNIDRYSNSIDVSKRKPLPATPGMSFNQSTTMTAFLERKNTLMNPQTVTS